MSKFTIRNIAAARPLETQDPFLFAVYHKDHYPAGDDQMQAPRRGNGSDWSVAAPYRMYHGDRVPGFPQHPHRGFETVTCTIEGLIDHTDSTGCAGRYGNGDLQWMTAGKGVVHGEMLPLIKQTPDGNVIKWFQIWLNLPKKSKMVDPNQMMHWAEKITKFTTPDSLTTATVWAGSLYGHKALPPIRDSWANEEANPGNDVNIWFLQIQPGGSITLPKAASSRSTRSLYFVEGTALTLNGATKVPDLSQVEFADPSQEEVLLENLGPKLVEVLVLQGRKMGEPVAKHGPFVMNTQQEIAQAFNDYRMTQFGGWPWPEDAMVFPREKGRFLALKGVSEELPPKSED
ncbi:RmlC-like cupin domain-containing protein [Chytriomyces cf. hyalinus JEL632]|nr:RmlC-like cupin domain-containing protein [Chytriomyces cf. hyalinus JEL632]